MGKDKGARLPAVIDPQKTVCISFEIPDADEYRRAVVGHIVLLTKWFFWEHDGSTRATDAARLFARLILETLNVGACCCPDQTKLLQDILQVQQQNFTLNFLNQETYYLTQWNTYWRNTDTNVYTVYNFAPVTTFVTTAGEPSEIANRREDALCYAVAKLVRAVYYEAQREKEGQQAQASLVLGGLSVLAGVGAIVSGGATIYLWMGLAATFGEVASGAISAIELADLTNAEVEQEIACALKNAMKNLPPTAASIKAAANAIRGAQPPNNTYDKMSNLIADLLTAYPDTELGNTFLANLSEATNPSFAGLPACQCEAGPEYEFVFMRDGVEVQTVDAIVGTTITFPDIYSGTFLYVTMREKATLAAVTRWNATLDTAEPSSSTFEAGIYDMPTVPYSIRYLSDVLAFQASNGGELGLSYSMGYSNIGSTRYALQYTLKGIIP